MTSGTRSLSDADLTPEVWRSRRQARCGQFNSVITLAIFVIGMIATSDMVPGTSMCWTTIALSSALLLTTLFSGRKPVTQEGRIHGRQCKMLFDSLLSIALITLNACVIRGIYAPAIVGYASVAPIALWQILNVCECLCSSCGGDSQG